jgi:hypothetical protein
MKINVAKQAGKKGSVFLVALGMTALFALILSSYLCLVEGQADSVARGQNFDSAIPVAEAGVEEAFSLINKNGGASSWTNNLTNDGWSAMTGSNTTTKSNLVSGLNYYQVTISNAPGSTPVITAAGVVPFIQNGWGIEMTTNTSISSSVVSLIRTIQVQTTQTPTLGAAIEAIGDITFVGNASVDSFNSMNTNLSVNGQYSATKVDDKATVATDSRVVSSISAGNNVTIRGYVNTGPGGTVVASGSIGDNAWVNSATPGIEASRSNDTFNVTFPDVATPSATFVETPSSGTVGGTNYSMVFEGNQFWGSSNVMYETSLSMSGHANAIVTDGSVVIYVPSADSFSLTGQATFYVAPGSSVSIYVGSSSASIAGNGFVGATNANQVAIYGLPSCTSISYAGNGAYVGTIYAPEAAFQGVGNAEIIGSLMANSFDFTGNATIHYDENLGSATASTFVANNWQEIATPLAWQALPP